MKRNYVIGALKVRKLVLNDTALFIAVTLYILIQNSDVDDQTATQIITSPDGQNENVTQDVDLEAPTQLQYDNDETGNTTQLLEQEHQGDPIQ